jgi:hypothetical protein
MTTHIVWALLCAAIFALCATPPWLIASPPIAEPKDVFDFGIFSDQASLARIVDWLKALPAS